MLNKSDTKTAQHPSSTYQIRLAGHLSPQWADWFDGLAITLEDDGCTQLTGTIVDQSALYGLLNKVRDLGMPLLSVMPVTTQKGDIADDTHECKP